MTAGEVWTLILSGIAALAVISIPLSARAVYLQKRAEDRALEARDIVWYANRYENDSRWYFAHSGSSSAHAVKIDLTIDGRTSTARFNEVPPDTEVQMTHQWHAELDDEARAEQARFDDREAAALEEREVDLGPMGIVSMPNASLLPVEFPTPAYRAEASFVITWRSALKVPDRQERSWTEVY